MAYLHRHTAADKPSAASKRRTSTYRRPAATARDPPSPTIPASYPTDAHRPTAAMDDALAARRRKARLPPVVAQAAASFMGPDAVPASTEWSPFLEWLLRPAIGSRGWAMIVAEWYLGCLDRRPLLTKAATSAVTHIIGDVLAQTITGVPVFDVARYATRWEDVHNCFQCTSPSPPCHHPTVVFDLLGMVFASAHPPTIIGTSC